MQIINMTPFDKQLLSPREFLDMNDVERHTIKSSKIVPPKLGSDSFGSIEVTYKTPKYTVHE